MKHALKITLLLVFIFFVTQVIGLSITNKYINHQTIAKTGEVTFKALPYNLERPQIEESTSYIWIIAAIIIGTLLMLLVVKFKKMSLWKLWFFLAVFFSMAIAFSAFINQTLAAILAFILALRKIYKPTIIISNITEIFIYGGLAAIFVPVINIFAVFMLLILISVYDINGRVVSILENNIKDIGEYNIVWEANNFSSGAYFIQCNVNNVVSTQKIMLIK